MYQDTLLSSPQVNKGTLEEESYNGSQDSDFNHEESDSLSIDLSDFVEKDKENFKPSRMMPSKTSHPEKYLLECLPPA